MILSGLSLRLLESKTPICVQAATAMKLKKPPNFDHVQMPERSRLKILEKVPQPMILAKPPLRPQKSPLLIRGPETLHNTIVYGEYGVQILDGCRIKHGHIEAIRNIIVKKLNQKTMFAQWRIDAPWFAITKRPVGVKLGGGKGKIEEYVVPVKADRIILEIGGKVILEEVEGFLTMITNILPGRSRIVSRQSLAEEAKEKERLEKENQNMFTFEYCAKNNMLGIKKILSPYDYRWHGKYK